MSDDEALPALTDIEADLKAVDRALLRLDDGSYGRCAVCGAGISADHLVADPLGERCSDHNTTTPQLAKGDSQTASASGGVASG